MEVSWRRIIQKAMTVIGMLSVGVYLVVMFSMAQGEESKQASEEMRNVLFRGTDVRGGVDGTAGGEGSTYSPGKTLWGRSTKRGEREWYRDMDFVMWGDSIVRQMYFNIVGYFNRSVPVLEVPKEKRHDNFTFYAEPLNLQASYRFVDFMRTLADVVNSLDCGCNAGEKAETQESRLVVYVIGVGLWDVLWHDTDTFMSESELVQERLAELASKCFSCLSTTAEEGEQETKATHTTENNNNRRKRAVVIVRGMTPVDEQKLPEHKKVMTNVKIQSYNEKLEKIVKHVQTIVEQEKKKTLTKEGDLASEGSLLPFQIRFFDSFAFYTREKLLESPDGVHFTPAAVAKDMAAILSLVKTIRQEEEKREGIPIEDFLEGGEIQVEKEEQDEVEQKGGSEATREPAAAPTSDNSTAAATAEKPKVEPKRGGDPCYEVGCLSLFQLGLLFLFSAAAVTVVCLRLWKGRRSGWWLFRQGGAVGDSVGGAAEEKGSLTALPLDNTSGSRDREKKDDDSILAGLRVSNLSDKAWAFAVTHEKAIQAFAILGLILLYMWLVDGPNRILLSHQGKTYSRDFFVFVLLCILLLCYPFVSTFSPKMIPKSYFTIPFIWASPLPPVMPFVPKDEETGEKEENKDEKKATGSDALEPASEVLNRFQTEEWKGWMQIMFLLYHYFNAKEVYNAIRLFIAAYVWMTGYGHFSYYYYVPTSDYGFVRVAKMLFRLNFLVVFMVMVMRNEYMLYYICALHTLVFLLAYLAMAFLRSYNDRGWFIQAKLVALFGLAYLLWDYNEGMVFKLIWYPFSWVVNLDGSLHEFYFRTNLDHYIWIWGMIFAYYYPAIERFLLHLERRRSFIEQVLWKTGMCALALGIGYYWCTTWFLMPDKFAYNAVHPYTSFIPIFLCIFFRNILVRWRLKYLAVLAWVGKSTLETYLLQFHLFLTSSSKTQVVYITGYPYVNFFIATAVFLWLSHVTMNLTTILSDSLIGPKDPTLRVLKRWLWLGLVFVVTLGWAFMVRAVLAAMPLTVFVGMYLLLLSGGISLFYLLRVRNK